MRRVTSILASIALLTAFAIPQTAPPKKQTNPTVYVVEKGKSYHKKNCKLKTDSKGMGLMQAKLKGYKACKVCKPG
jgi:hypothetical protein